MMCFWIWLLVSGMDSEILTSSVWQMKNPLFWGVTLCSLMAAA